MIQNERDRARVVYALLPRNAGKHNHVKRRCFTGMLGIFYNSRNGLWVLAIRERERKRFNIFVLCSIFFIPEVCK